MKPIIVPSRLALLFTGLALATSSYGAIVASTQESATVPFASTTWAGQVSNSDLINTGSAALAGKTISASFFGPNGANDGLATPDSTTENTFFYRGNSQFPATAQFDLNITTNTLGYSISSIQSFMGWATVSQAQANQTYVVSVSLVGSSAFTDIATVSYRPFADVNGANYESHVVLTQDNGTGILASNVDSIKFTFLDPITVAGGSGVVDGTGTVEGTVIRELDVTGFATVPEPSSALLGALGCVGLIARRRRA